MPPLTRHQRMQRNQDLPCDATECHQRRYRLNRFCALHQARQSRFGSWRANGTHPTVTELRPYLDWARRFIGRLPETAQEATLKVVHALLDSGSDGRPVSLGRDLQRLRSGGVTPAEILETCVAVAAFAGCNPRLFPTDQIFIFALGRRVLRLRPLPRSSYYSHSMRREVVKYHSLDCAAVRIMGEALYGDLRPLLVRIQSGIGKNEERRVARARGLIQAADETLTGMSGHVELDGVTEE